MTKIKAMQTSDKWINLAMVFFFRDGRETTFVTLSDILIEGAGGVSGKFPLIFFLLDES